MPSLVFLNIVAAVCLLLWGLRHLKHGMMKGFGDIVRKLLQFGTTNRFLAVISGIIVTLMVQSSTAAILILGTFISQGFVTLSSGIALALGADLGTALVAAILSMDMGPLGPILVILGMVMYSVKSHHALHNLGRVFSGLGLMLISLGIIKETAAPLSESELLPVIFKPLEDDPIFGIFLIALLTWLFHSSLAMILLIMSLSIANVIQYDFALYLVLGANVGGALPAIFASWHDRKASRIPIANGLIRLTGAIAVFSFIPMISVALVPYSGETAFKIILFHLLFNAGLCVLALPFTNLIGKFVKYLRPNLSGEKDEGRARYLDKDLIDTPSIALANCRRETLRMAEMVERMLKESIETFEKRDTRMILRIQDEDDIVDRLYGAIKKYIARLLAYEELEEKEATEAVQILMFATNLEHIGDIIDKNLMALAEKKNRLHQDFSEEGLSEIKKFHGLVLDSLIQAQQVFMSSDNGLAQRMLDQKRNEIREAEELATEQHIKRLRDGVPATMATTSIHLDIIRDFRRINTYASSVAYDILKDKEVS